MILYRLLFFLRLGKHYQIVCILYGIYLPASHCKGSDVLECLLDELFSIENRIGDMQHPWRTPLLISTL
uniref:Putative secreted protein n=1 Tax=Xenopsylla cheopis TaxID=163159 RepID=A0A6M2DYC4_XENCH